MEENYQVVVHGLRDENVTISLCSTAEQMQNMTVTQLKEKIAVKLPVAADKFMLIYADHMLDDDSLLCEYGIQHISKHYGKALKRLLDYGVGTEGKQAKRGSQENETLAT